MSNARNLANLLGTDTQITTADIADAAFQANKNLIINGACVIDQRNGGSSITPTDGQFSADRWQANVAQSSKLTIQQSTTAPTGFSNSLLVTSSSAYSVTSSDYFYIRQNIEGYNFAHLEFGSANAKTFTLSFWVRSSLTGTFGGALNNGAGNRSYAFTYTISSADTWEYKTITVTGDTSGTWLTTNGKGLSLDIGLGVGSTYSGTAGSWAGSLYLSATGATSVVGTSGATFYITGVQLEVGEQATPFEHRSYGDELARCERYYQIASPLAGNANGTNAKTSVSFKTAMRTQPTLSFASNSFDFTDGYLSNYASTNANPSWTFYVDSGGGVFSTANHASVSGDARQNTMLMNGSAQKLFMDAEL